MAVSDLKPTESRAGHVQFSSRAVWRRMSRVDHCVLQCSSDAGLCFTQCAGLQHTAAT